MSIKWFSLLVGALMLLLVFQPATVDLAVFQDRDDQYDEEDLVQTAMRDRGELLAKLMAVTTDLNHSDSDGMPDSVEWVIGTDPRNPDSDFDGIDDRQEILFGLDPMSPDSNRDRFPDLREFEGVPMDLDGDGDTNAWDRDNDGDGVDDHLDISPFASTAMTDMVRVSVSYGGDPLFVTFQLRTADPEHLGLTVQTWDWPSDARGSMKDLDRSSEDVTAAALLRVSCSAPLDQDELHEYGMVLEEGNAYVPLFPVWDMGRVVALKGRMYVPATGAQQLDLEAELVWKVNGLTDVPIAELLWGAGESLVIGEDGQAVVSASGSEEERILQWKDLGGGMVALAGSNGLYLSVDGEGVATFSGPGIDEASAFRVHDVQPSGTTLTAWNGNPLAVNSTGAVLADGAHAPGTDLFSRMDLGYRSSMITLAYYDEGFMLTGLSAEENHGTALGLVYGDDREDMVSANLIMAYDYLRTAENDLGDVAGMLDAHVLDYSMMRADYGTSDEATRALVNMMMPAAREQDDGTGISYYISAMTDRSTCLELSQVSMGLEIAGPLTLDMGSLEPVTTRLLRTSWFEDESAEAMDLHRVVGEMGTWGLDLNDLELLTALMASWCVGELVVTNVGDLAIEHDFPEGQFISETVDGIVGYGLAAIDLLMVGMEVLTCAYAFSETFVAMGQVARSAAQSTWNLFKESFTSVYTSLAGSTGTYMSRFFSTMNVVGLVITAVLSLYAFFSIGFETGWSSVGTGVAVTTALFGLAYSIVLIGVASIAPPVGAVIAGLIAIVDVLGLILFGSTWGQELLGWIIDICTKTEQRSDVTIETVHHYSGLMDLDGNGLDAGDRIWFMSRNFGNVSMLGPGNQQDVIDSYIIPSQTMSVPYYPWSVTGGNTTVLSTDTGTSYRSTLYETEAWVEPGVGMVNFPVAIGMTTDYRVYYDDCWWFFGWWCDRESYTSSQSTSWTTLYYDVMPGSIFEFAAWRGISSNDHDGDGLGNMDENGSDPWSADSDQDGLGDDYERQIGTDPGRADPDGDGLGDREEVIWGLDPWARDSDRDGLTDGMESSGWVVNFTYQGSEFFWHVRSDPSLPDTDGDSLTDLEEYHGLTNPLTADTDGDGVMDELRGYYRTDMTYVKSILRESDPIMSNRVAVGDDGCIFVGGVEEEHVHVFAPNGTWMRSFPFFSGQGQSLVDMEMGRDGLLYIVSDRVVHVFTQSGERVRSIDPILANDSEYYCITGIGLDDQRYIYLSFGSWDWYDQMSKVRRYHWNGSFDRDMVVGQVHGAERMDQYKGLCVDAMHDIYVVDRGMWKVQVLDENGVLKAEWSEKLDEPVDIALDLQGNLLVTNQGYYPYTTNAMLQKFTPSGHWMYEFGFNEEYPLLDSAYGVTVNSENDILLGEWNVGCVHLIGHNVTWYGPTPPPVIDSDGDGLSDEEERAGWNVTADAEHDGRSMDTWFTSSDPFTADTDRDGLGDRTERDLGTDPRSRDTDRDRLKDDEEAALGTDPCSWDSDGDGLGDARELGFGSDPLAPDSDGDGLGDLSEFELGTDPWNGDSDGDGLGDMQEFLAGSDPRDADSDDDFLFDGAEFDNGTALGVGDTDGDGISDGYEMLHGTLPLEGDTDGDGLGDGFEVALSMDPLCNDTDGDGLNDSYEVDNGLNPRNTDSDLDGVPDGLDEDHLLTLQEEVCLVMDPQQLSEGFLDDLAGMANITLLTADQLLSDHRDARYVVLIGDPGNIAGSAGSLISQLIPDDVLLSMSSPAERVAVRYGVWTPLQTVVMFSQTFDGDASRAVGVLKSMSVTVGDGGYLVQYHNPRSCFKLDWIDAVQGTDTLIWAKMDAMDTFQVEVDRADAGEAPAPLDAGHGLANGWTETGRYVRAEFQPDGPGTGLLGATVRMYYFDEDLDRDGDGCASEPTDLSEDSLGLWTFLDGQWTLLPGEVNATDLVLFGTRYSGYVEANATELGWFALAGRGQVIELRVEMRSPNGNGRISLNSGGHVNAYIYGCAEAEGNWIDLGSLRIGNVCPVMNKNGHWFQFRDVDADGRQDLVVSFSVSELVADGVLNKSTTALELEGCLDAAHGSVRIEGTAAISIPPGQA